MKRSTRIIVTAMLLLAVGLGGYVAGAGGLGALTTSLAAQGECQTFPETGHQVCGRFLAYWRVNGGLAQQGLPLSGEFDERSSVNGQTYKVQYFERAVFELHPENQPPFDVLLSLLGRETFLRKYPAGLPTGETPLAAGQALVLPGNQQGVTFSVTVTDVQEATELGRACTEPSVAKGKFVVVVMRITNQGLEPTSLSSFRIRDSMGRSFESTNYCAQASAADRFKRKTSGTTVQPGLSENIVEVFDVAPDATNFTIVPRTR